jgi:hypothetical protein
MTKKNSAPRAKPALDPFKVFSAIMKHNSARAAKTMEFPIGKFARGANTMVKTIYSRGGKYLGLSVGRVCCIC